MTIRSRYDQVDALVKSSSLPSKTRSEFAKDTDVNRIIDTFARTKQMPHLNPRQGRFGDFTTAEDLQQSLDRVAEAFSEFAELPSEIRAYFNNNPIELAEFMADQSADALSEGAEIGLYDPNEVSRVLAERQTLESQQSGSQAVSTNTPELRGESPARTEPEASAEGD